LGGRSCKRGVPAFETPAKGRSLQFIWSALGSIGLRESVVQFMLVNALLALSIYLTLHTGMFSLANAAFMSIGAYVGVICTQEFGLPLGLALVAGMLAAGLIAWPLGAPVLRLSDVYLAIATLGFGEIVRIFMLNLDPLASSILGRTVIVTGGALGIKGIPKTTTTAELLLALVLASYFMMRLAKSRFGRAMPAIRQDEAGAASVGVNIVYVKTIIFILSAVLAAAAGVLSSHLTRIIGPGDFGFTREVSILAFAVLGGTSVWFGPIVGALVLTALPEVARPLQQYNQVVSGIVLLLAIVYLPGGLVDPALWSRLRPGLGKPPAQENLPGAGLQ
jgi:branched-chain amino acid transport system permease protein